MMYLSQTLLISLVLAGSLGSPLEWRSEVAARSIEWQGTGKPEWTDNFGTANADWANRTIELSDGAIMTAGFLNRADGTEDSDWDVVLRKYQADGRLIWSRRIGGRGLEAGWTVRELADGRLAVSGMSSPAGASSNDAYLLLTDRDGTILFEGRYGGPGEDRATDVLVAADGGLLLLGQTDSFGAGERDVLLIRTDAAGTELWRKAYGGPGVDRGFFGAATADGGFVVAGITGVQGNYDYMLMKVDRDGKELWRRVVAGDKNDPNHGLALLPDGRIVFTGYTQSWGSSEHDISVLIYSPDGELRSHQIIAAPGDDRAQFSAAGPDGSIWITGYTKSFGAGDWDIMVARVAPDGKLEPWMGAIRSPWNDNGSSISVARNGDLLISGYSAASSEGKSPSDAFVMRVKPDAIERRTQGVTVRKIP